MEMEMELTKLIDRYYEVRDLIWPTPEQAILWVITELGETCEWLLIRDPSQEWVRNNPEDKPTVFDREEAGRELGDAIKMLIVAGMQLGVDPLYLLREKLYNKIQAAQAESAEARSSAETQKLEAQAGTQKLEAQAETGPKPASYYPVSFGWDLDGNVQVHIERGEGETSE